MKIKQLYELENGAELEMAPVTIPDAVKDPVTQESLTSMLEGKEDYHPMHLTYTEEWDHTKTPYKSGVMIKFNQEFFVALKETSLPPVDLILMEDGVIAKVDEHTYATKGSYDAEGNKDDWRKIPYDELRLSSRYGTLNGEEVDVRTLATAEDVYQLEPHLYIDLLRGILKAKKVDFPNLPKKNVTDALGYVPATSEEVSKIKIENQYQEKRLNALDQTISSAIGALPATFTLEQSSDPSFEVLNQDAAKLYISQMGGYLFYNGNSDGKVYAAKLNPYDWGKFADGTPVTEAIEAATETMVHVPECHFKASGKTLTFGGVIPVAGGHTFGSPHWVGAYPSHIDNGSLHSRPNVVPSDSQTISAFWNYAQSLHSNKKYGLANYQFHCLINALYQARYGNLNSQEVVGRGFNSPLSAEVINLGSGYTKKLGDGSGKVHYNDNTIGEQYPIKLFGFEDLWGKLWELRPGIRFESRSEGRYAIVYDGNKVSNTATGREFLASMQSANELYTTSMKLGEHWDMIPEDASNGGNILYFCDGVWAALGGELIFVGGNSSYAQLIGVSCVSSNSGYSVSGSGIGARLAYWGEPEIIGGAQLVAMINS